MDWKPTDEGAGLFGALYAIIFSLIEQGAIDEQKLKGSLQVILDDMPSELRAGPHGFFLEKLVKHVGSQNGNPLKLH
ncbi:hypothetical protein [Mesorhizobium huakuii]|uniref:Uncharacterized protein n=1 Tax=Mesorhizobium huakuii TaxID=28104 RepID=A0A7G6SSC0_9HYPH|nr:hypothetical protein [Mesorhizobium huakuii]QND57402.1 hypothetical protein HB778_12830 [Mesorhizobium huakuii]